jgi:hypothetical protein
VSVGSKEHHRAVKRAIRWNRAAEASAAANAAAANANGGNNADNPNHLLAVPLFDRWQ